MAQPDDNTSTLLHRLFEAPDIAAFLQSDGELGTLPAFHVFITALCQSAGLVPEQIIRRAAIDRTYGHQLFNGTRRPSRDKVLQLAFGFGLTVEGGAGAFENRPQIRAVSPHPAGCRHTLLPEPGARYT